MPTPNSIRALYASLEAARLKTVEIMAAGVKPSPDALHELATLQMALMGVRELLERHQVAVGREGDEDQLEEAVSELSAKVRK